MRFSMEVKKLKCFSNKNKNKPKQKSEKMSKITSYEIQIMPNGKWRNMRPDYIVFNDHIKEGLHECPTCKCSFCQEPSTVALVNATHKTDGRSCGLMYCTDCFMMEHATFLKGCDKSL